MAFAFLELGWLSRPKFLENQGNIGFFPGKNEVFLTFFIFIYIMILIFLLVNSLWSVHSEFPLKLTFLVITHSQG